MNKEEKDERGGERRRLFRVILKQRLWRSVGSREEVLGDLWNVLGVGIGGW